MEIDLSNQIYMKGYAQNILDGISKNFKKNLCAEHNE